MKLFKMHPIKTLILSCLCLSLYRVFSQWDMVYLFLVFNLFLAWIPYHLSKKVHQTNNIYIQLGLVGLVILFLPNASYLLTDFVHFRKGLKINLWYDLVLFFTYALTGLTLTLYTIDEILCFVSHRFKKNWLTQATYLLFPAIGVGIYLGRVERFNSWDVFLHPFQFSRDLMHLVTSNKLIHMIEFTLLFGLFTGIIYVLFGQIRNTKEVKSLS